MELTSLQTHMVIWLHNASSLQQCFTLTATPGSPGGPGSPGNPTGPFQEDKYDTSECQTKPACLFI